MKNINNKVIRFAVITAISATMIGCGGGGGSSSDNILTGRLLDSAVINVDYKTPTQSGVTSEAGEFNYLAGEMITFGNYTPKSAKPNLISFL